MSTPSPSQPPRAAASAREEDAAAPPAALGGRPDAAWLRLAVVLAWPMAVLSALWVAFGRLLFGAGGLLVAWFSATVLPALLVVLLLAAWRSAQDARRHASRGTTPTIAVVQLLTWVLAFLFGFLVPDRVDGRSTSAAARVLGDDVLGLSAGFGNTAGILTFVGAFACLFLAVAAERRSRSRLQGRPATEDEILDAQGFGDDADWLLPGQER